MPYNIASYSFLLYILCEITNYRPGQMYYTFGDSHIYLNHIEQCEEQISRKPYDLPKLKISNKNDINAFDFNDFEIIDYMYHPTIKGLVSV